MLAQCTHAGFSIWTASSHAHLCAVSLMVRIPAPAHLAFPVNAVNAQSGVTEDTRLPAWLTKHHHSRQHAASLVRTTATQGQTEHHGVHDMHSRPAAAEDMPACSKHTEGTQETAKACYTFRVST